MSKYKYTVEGVDYDVEIEEIEDNVAKVLVNGIPFEVELKQPVKPTQSHVRKTVTAPQPATVEPRPAEKPVAKAELRPPKSHIVVDTRPTAAASSVLRCPSIAASIICIAMKENCAIIVGIDKRIVRCNFWYKVISHCLSRTKANSSSFVILIH